MNYDINFRFLTRTFSEDYRVFYRKGDRLVTLSDLVEFAPLRTKVNIIYEHKPYAAIFEECGKIFLVVSGMRRGVTDRAGKAISFAFCQIFQQAEKLKAYNSFRRVVLNFSEAERKLQSSIREISVKRLDWQNQEVSGEDIEFDQTDFIAWLQGSSDVVKTSQLQKARTDTSYPADTFIWPIHGNILVWEEASRNVIKCRKIGGKSSVNLTFWIAVASILIIGGVIAFVMAKNGTDTVNQTMNIM